MKPGHRYTVGEQPCQDLLRGDADIPALGDGNRRNVHQCPICEGNRTWCDNCHTDHHDGGWETCKPGAYAEAPEPCTEDAREAGCSCRMETSHAHSIDPPEPIIDRHCPLHGAGERDPDDAREEREERRMLAREDAR